MFRAKLIFTISVLLIIVLLLSATLFWGTHRSQYYFERSQLAQDAAQAYIQISHDAYRHFKQLVDIVVLLDDNSVDQAILTYEKLYASISELKMAIAAEIDQVDKGKKNHELLELKHVSELEHLLTEGVWAFDRIILLQRKGDDIPAKRVLTSVMEETIDQQFKPLIDSLISAELEEVQEAREQAEKLSGQLKLVASLTAVFAFFLAMAMAIWLWRSLSMPLNQLVSGVRQVAEGDLAYSIDLSGSNEFTYLAKNFNDMTQKLADKQQMLLLAQTELEDKVVVRTHELQLVNDKLQKIDQGRRRFFADISHELRTPLAAIKGDAEVALRGKEKTGQEYRESLERVVGFANQLGKLVDDLLFMARSESSNFRFDLHPLLLSKMITELCDEAEALVQQQQCQMVLEISDTPLSVYGDRQRLRQLLLILIDNASRYSDPGGVITISLATTRHGYATLSIRDQGIGIPSAELDAVFERFYRVDQACKKAPCGSGLGLPLAKSIVEAHQGKIELSSKLGEGTCVTVTLPAIV